MLLEVIARTVRCDAINFHPVTGAGGRTIGTSSGRSPTTSRRRALPRGMRASREVALGRGGGVAVTHKLNYTRPSIGLQCLLGAEPSVRRDAVIAQWT